MNPESPEAGTNLFRPDEPVSSVEQDRFDHRHFAEALKYVICNGEPPLNIALYGKWGVGKSSVLEFFRTEIFKDRDFNEKFVFVTIDVWKLSPHILKQEFLEALNLKLDKPIAHEEIEDRLWHQKEESLNQNTSWRSKYALAIGSCVAIATGLVFANQYFGSYFENQSVLSSSVVTSVIPILVVMANELRSISKSALKSRKTLISRIESHAQFQKLFKDIVRSTKNHKQPIIAIDNLDRCDDESVVSILSMIKTFLDDPKCFFIVACDQDAIITHLQGKKERFDQRYAKEFLSKFFQVSLHIPNQIKGQLYEYAKSQLGVFGSNIEFGPDVADIFANAGTKNPRKIRQFVYNFAIAHKIASRKEDEGTIAKGAVTGNTPFLAKVTVLREDWPGFFQKLEKTPAILKRIQEFIEDGSNPEYGEILKDNEGLKHFLRSTGTIKSAQILPFMQLTQESFEAPLPKLDKLIVAVNHNDAESVKEIVQEDPEKQHGYILKLCSLAEEYVENGRNMVASHALSMLVNMHDIVDEKSKEQIIKLLNKFMAGNDVLDNIVMFDVDAMFSITPSLDPGIREGIYLEYAKTISVPDSSFLILKKLVSQDSLISSLVCDSIDSNLGSWAQNDQELFYDVTTWLMKSSAPEKFIKENILKEIIGSTRSGKDRWTERYLELKHLASENSKLTFVKKMLSTVEIEVEGKMQSIHRQTYETLGKLSLDDFTPDTAKYAYNTLKHPASRYADVSDKVLVTEIIVKIYTKLDRLDKQEFATDIFAPLIRQSNPQNLGSIAKAIREENVEILEFESVAEGVFSLLQNAPSRESIELMYAGMPEGKWQDMEEKIIKIHDTDVAKVAIFASAFELSARAPKETRTKVLVQMAKSCKNSNYTNKLLIYQKLFETLEFGSGWMGAFANNLSFEPRLNDHEEIHACLELAEKCFEQSTETKRREIFSTLFVSVQECPIAKADSRTIEFLISKNKNMDPSEKDKFRKIASKILQTNNNTLIAKILDEFNNMDLGANHDLAYKLVCKLRESADKNIRNKAQDIMRNHGSQ